MKELESLPEPSRDAREHSSKLVERIREEIHSSQTTNPQGSITFRRYMEMALFEPGLGYYVAGNHKIGSQGDFVTAPEISPLFSRCVAHQCYQVLSELTPDKQRNILEFGAGSGSMAAEILLQLEQLNCLPDHYYILDLSPDLKQRQQQTLKECAPHLLERVDWLHQLPQNFNGIMLGNEILDAMPVEVFTQQNHTVFQHHVIWDEKTETLQEQLQLASEGLTLQVQKLNITQAATPYTSEINPNLTGWFEMLGKSLQQGVILLIDYGYSRADYYHPQRNKGTLICHYQHRVNEAPLYYPGLQDITANVDFTAVAEAADDAGFTVCGYTTQGAFLTSSKLETYFSKELEGIDKNNIIKANNEIIRYQLAQQIRSLTLPTEMGERFKCIALSRNFESPLEGFSQMNLLHKL